MNRLNRSDVWFAVVTLMFFSFLGLLFFKSAISSEAFWLKVALIVGFTFLAKLMSKFLKPIGHFPESLGAFVAGFAFAVVYQMTLGSDEIDFLMAMISGLGFSMVTFAFRRQEDNELPSD